MDWDEATDCIREIITSADPKTEEGLRILNIIRRYAGMKEYVATVTKATAVEHDVPTLTNFY